MFTGEVFNIGVLAPRFVFMRCSSPLLLGIFFWRKGRGNGFWLNTWGRKGVVDDSIPDGAGEITTSTFSLPAELIGIGKVFFRVVPN